MCRTTVLGFLRNDKNLFDMEMLTKSRNHSPDCSGILFCHSAKVILITKTSKDKKDIALRQAQDKLQAGLSF